MAKARGRCSESSRHRAWAPGILYPRRGSDAWSCLLALRITWPQSPQCHHSGCVEVRWQLLLGSGGTAQPPEPNRTCSSQPRTNMSGGIRKADRGDHPRKEMEQAGSAPVPAPARDPGLPSLLACCTLPQPGASNWQGLQDLGELAATEVGQGRTRLDGPQAACERARRAARWAPSGPAPQTPRLAGGLAAWYPPSSSLIPKSLHISPAAPLIHPGPLLSYSFSALPGFPPD